MKNESVERMKKSLKKNNKDELWFTVLENFNAGASSRLPYERKWLINLAFVAGRQYSFFNSSANQLQQAALRKGRLKIVDNKLLPYYRKQVSRLIRNTPTMSVIPNSNMQDDIEAARTAEKVLKSFWGQARMKKKMRQLAGFIYTCGNAFLDDRWDPKKGTTDLDVETGEIKYSGDVDCGVWSPFDIYIPAYGLGDDSLHEQPWIIKAKFRSLDYIRSRFKRGKEVAAERREDKIVNAEMLLAGGTGKTGSDIDGAMVMEMDLKPNHEHPKGLHIIAANGVILHKSDYPFNHYHLEHFKDQEIPGVFWGMATLEAGIWLQKLWNRQISDIVEFNRSMARGKYLVPRNSKMEVGPDDSHGQVLMYTPVMGHKPEQMRLTSLPRTYEIALQQIAQSLMGLFDQHEVSQGTNKSDIRSGDMVQLLLEQDSYGVIPTHAIFEEALEEVMKRVLRRIQKGYGDDRMIKIVGRDNDYEVMAFKGADLRDNTDVTIKKGSSLPDSRAGRQAQIIQRYREELYGERRDPEVRRHVMNMLDDASVQDIYSEVKLDEQNAKLENRAIASQPGAKVIINLYDNHAVHMRTHTLFEKSREVQRVKVENPKAFKIFSADMGYHKQMHQKILQEEMEQQIAQQQAMEGKK